MSEKLARRMAAIGVVLAGAPMVLAQTTSTTTTTTTNALSNLLSGGSTVAVGLLAVLAFVFFKFFRGGE